MPPSLELPAPISVCISSINRMTLPISCTQDSTFLMRSSNSPRYLLPAIICAMSSAQIWVSLSIGGTSPRAILAANPSASADLPTPGSPMSSGLFFVFLPSTRIMASISALLPMSGSSSPLAAARVRLRAY